MHVAASSADVAGALGVAFVRDAHGHRVVRGLDGRVGAGEDGG